MAGYRIYMIKAGLIGVFIFFIFNLMNSHNYKHLKSFSFTHESPQMHHRFFEKYPSSANTSSIKIIPSSLESSQIAYMSESNSNRNIIVQNETFKHNSAVFIDSSDFHRKFPNYDANINITINSTSQPKLTTKSGQSGIFHAVMTTLGLNMCPIVPPDLYGPIEVNITTEKLDTIAKHFSGKLSPGGWYRPKQCNARDRVAIIVPFRDRYIHLPIFLKNIHPFLMKQQIEYGIFIIEQSPQKHFNRAALMNVGFLEAQKLFNWDCFIFHDIDLIPLDDRNLYTCPDQPRHMSVAVDVFKYKLPYDTIFGGVSAMTTNQFQKVNGFSNSFWGWGGEDDDMSNRLTHAGFHISRYPVNIGRYMMLNHRKEKANPKRYEQLANGAKKYDTDGINSVKYIIQTWEKLPLFTWFLVELQLEEGR